MSQEANRLYEAPPGPRKTYQVARMVGASGSQSIHVKDGVAEIHDPALAQWAMDERGFKPYKKKVPISQTAGFVMKGIEFSEANIDEADREQLLKMVSLIKKIAPNRFKGSPTTKKSDDLKATIKEVVREFTADDREPDAEVGE